uniref:Uncharacterized protein n=1 Tax=Anguilla anguilla TaxID=7936 RepID=A0A0E9PY74_ANGAN
MIFLKLFMVSTDCFAFVRVDFLRVDFGE